MRVILIPVKSPEQAKKRLAPLLTPEERTALVWAMLKDVTKAVQACTRADRIVVVGRSSDVSRYATSQGWSFLEDDQQTSESRSVDRASKLLMADGATAVLRIPGDIPLIQGSDVDQLLMLGSRVEKPGAVMVPSRDFMGTNALLRTPPDVFPSRFGPNSFELHQTEALLVGADVLFVENERISIDLDTAADIQAFLSMPSITDTETKALLEDLRVGERFKHLSF